MPISTSSRLNMSSTNSPDHNSAFNLPSTTDRRVLIEEIACAISGAQAALLAGRIQDFESCISRQQELCALWKRLEASPVNSSPGNADDRDLIQAARRVQRQSLVFSAVVRRMRRHLETLRHVLNGLSLTYAPKPVKAPVQEG